MKVSRESWVKNSEELGTFVFFGDGNIYLRLWVDLDMTYQIIVEEAK